MINTGVQLEIPGRLLLLPYLPVHVPQYHAWMCRPELLEATESEPLTLAEEEENQASWLQSLDKLTFIIYAPQEPTAAATGQQAQEQSTDESSVPLATTMIQPDVDAVEYVDDSNAALCKHYQPSASRNMFTAAEVPADEANSSTPVAADAIGPDIRKDDRTYVMIGDCNLFLLPDSDEDEEEEDDLAKNKVDATMNGKRSKRVFEIEIMIAETTFRRRGCAEGAARLLMQYAASVLRATAFMAKILEDNETSITLFTKKLHFAEVKRVKVFHEIHYCRALFPAATDKKKTQDEEEATAAYHDWVRECLRFSGGKAFFCSPLKGVTV